jgi:hypothetical protein
MTVPFKFGWSSSRSRIPVEGYLFEEARRKELRNLCTTLSPFRTVDAVPEELLSLFGTTMPFQEFGESAVFVPDDGKDSDCLAFGFIGETEPTMIEGAVA